MLTVGIVEPAEAPAYIAALEAGAADPEWKCSPALNILVPPQDEIEEMVGNEIEVAIGCSEGGAKLGFMLFRPESGRIRWLLAEPSHFVEATRAMVVFAYQQYGIAPWGYIEGDTSRLSALGGDDETEIVEQKTGRDGVMRSTVRWVPPA